MGSFRVRATRVVAKMNKSVVQDRKLRERVQGIEENLIKGHT
jgi:hypothetical protein